MHRTQTLADLGAAAKGPFPVITPPAGRRVRSMLLPAALLLATAALFATLAATAFTPHLPVEAAIVVVRGTPAAESGRPGPFADSADRSSATPTVLAAGWLEADPFVYAATALADGVVDQFEVLEGDSVRAGEVIARLNDEEARLTLAEAEARFQWRSAAVGTALADSVAARRTLAEPYELNLRVATARALLREREAELSRHPARQAVEDAAAALLEEEVARQRRAADSQAVNELERIRSERALEIAQANARATREERPILEALVEAAAAELHAAERALALRIEETRRLDVAESMVRLAEAQREEARVERDRAELMLARMTVRSPIDGIVQRRLRKPGDIVGPRMDDPHGAHLAYLYDPKQLQARIDVPLADARFIQLNGPVDITAEAMPGRVFRGRVTRITHEADLQKNTLEVKVRIDEPDPMLRPEMLIRARFTPQAAESSATSIREAPDGGLFIPRQAIESMREGRIAVVDERRGRRGVIRFRAVRVDTSDSGEWIRASGDVRPGDVVVTSSRRPPVEGMRVRIIEREGGASS